MSPTGIDWNSIQWEKLIPRLLLFTAHIKARFLRQGGGLDPHDLVLGAIEKTLSGTRKWDPENLSLFHHLAGVIRSDIYNEMRKIVAQRNIPLDAAISEIIESDAPTPEQHAAFRMELSDTLAFLRSSDEKLADLANAIVFLGADSAQELAVLLELPVEAIYERKRRLHKLLAVRSDKAARVV